MGDISECPGNCDSGPLARDMAIFRFPPTGHAWGPDGPIWGPTDTVLGGKRVQTWPKADPNVTQLYSVHQQWQPDLPRSPMDTPQPVFGIFGPFLFQNFSKCPGGQNTSKSPIPAGGGSDRKKSMPREKCGKASQIAR